MNVPYKLNGIPCSSSADLVRLGNDLSIATINGIHNVTLSAGQWAVLSEVAARASRETHLYSSEHFPPHPFTRAHPNSGNQHCTVCDVREDSHA